MDGNDTFPDYLQKPSRRRILSTSTSLFVAGLAGCTGGDENSNDSGSPSRDTPDEDDQLEETVGPAETQTPSPKIEPSAEVVGSEVFTAPFLPDGEGDNIPWIRVDVRNDTDVPHRQIRVETRLRSTDDSILDTREGYTVVLPANTTWRYYHRQDQTVSRDEIDDVEHAVLEQETGIRDDILDEAEVLNSSLSFDDPVASVTGEVNPGRADLSRVTIVGLVYDPEGQFRGAVRDVEINPNATDTIAFDAGFAGFRTPSSEPGPDSFDLLIIGGFI